MKETPTIDEQQKFYDDWNARFRNSKFEEIEEESRARGHKVIKAVGMLPLERPQILEVGCGTGWLAEKMCKFGQTTGIDLSPKAIEIAEQRNCGARFIAADLYKYDLAEEYFDLILCIETIFYVSDQRRFIEKLAAFSKPGGFLVLTAVNKFVYERRSDIGPPAPGQIRKWLTRKELVNLIKPHFKIREMSTVLPKGNQGILRYLNSYKLIRLLSMIISERILGEVKEKLGLGHTRVIIGERI